MNTVSASDVRTRLLAALREAGQKNLSTSQLCEQAGFTKVEQHSYVRPQLRWLAARGTITRTPGGPRGRPWGLPLPIRLLLVLIHLRTNLTTRALAALFNTSQSAVDRIIHHLIPVLADALQPTGARDDRPWIIDGMAPWYRAWCDGAPSRGGSCSAPVCY